MKRAVALTIGILLASSVTATTSQRARPGWQPLTTNDEALVSQKPPPIKVTITTGGGLFGPPKERFHVGEVIPITITMTNPTDEPEAACITGPLYQDLPRLIKDGQPLPYMSWQAYELSTARRSNTCIDESLPETVLLKTHEARVVDWFVLSDYAALGADAWYDQLSPGVYQLSVQRRFNCCEGAMVDSNKINFEVVP